MINYGALIAEGKLKLDSVVVKQLDTNTVGRVKREAFWSHLKQVATERVKNTTVEEKA